MADERKFEERRAEERKAARRLPTGKQAAKTDFDAFLTQFENQASRMFRMVEGWVSQGEELLGTTREWINAHPVSKSVATRALAGMSLPDNMDELRERVRDRYESVRDGASDLADRLRENPRDAVLLGVAAGLTAFVVVRQVRAASA